MLYSFSLDEAIDNPPPCIADHSDQATSNGRTERSVLAGWIDRPSIQNFMNVIAAGYAKQQRERHERQQMERNHLDQALSYQQKQQQQNSTDTPISTLYDGTSLSDPALNSNKPKTTIPTQTKKKTKVRKVMKGGVLVAMPTSARQLPSAGRTGEQATKGKSLPFTSNNDNFGSGNILDDILARSQENDESIVGRKKSVLVKRADEKGSSDSEIINEDTSTLKENSPNQETTSQGEKRPRYSSVTSESSGSDDHQVSIFDRVRGFSDGQSENQESTDLLTVGDLNTKLTGTCNNQLLTQEPSSKTQVHENEHIKEKDLEVNKIKSNEDERKNPKDNENERKERAKSYDKEQDDSKRKESVNDKYKTSTSDSKRSRQNDKLLVKPQDHNLVRITRSMSLSDVETSQCNDHRNRRPLPKRNNYGNSHPSSSPQNSNHQKRLPPLKPLQTTVVGDSANVDTAPSLLSMVSGEAVDITVAQQELSDTRKNHRRGGRKKRRNKQTEWYLRQQQKEKELRAKGGRFQQQTQREMPACTLYIRGICAKGSTCRFKHEKIKELCSYYVSNVCEKFMDGMCPRLHDEFPCRFFHKTRCKNGNNCKFSHAPLTPETREMLEKYLVEVEARRQIIESASTVTSSIPPDRDTASQPIHGKNEISTSISFTATNNAISQVTKGNTPSNVKRSLCTDSNFSKRSTPGNKSNSTLLVQSIRKSVVDGPKVKRLCSLSSYKPQILSPLARTDDERDKSQPVEKKAENITFTRKNFLPGMFTEK